MSEAADKALAAVFTRHVRAAMDVIRASLVRYLPTEYDVGTTVTPTFRGFRVRLRITAGQVTVVDTFEFTPQGALDGQVSREVSMLVMELAERIVLARQAVA